MKIDRQVLTAAVDNGVLTASQAEQLWTFLVEQPASGAWFNFTHILYYLGGLIAIGAMTLFMTLGWERFGGPGIVAISLVYAVGGLLATEHLLHARKLKVPAGIMATFVIALTPLTVYGVQQWLGWWDDSHPYRDYHVYIDWNWIMMELATIAVGIIVLYRYRLPFLTMPVAVTLWYLSMDLVPFLFQSQDWSWELRSLVSVHFGLAMLGVAFWVDLRSRRGPDYAFWLHLFGVMTFWGGLSMLDSDSELSKLMYCAINLLMIGIGAAFGRRVFVVFGGLGVAGYLGHLAYDVFKNSLLFPFALSFIGFGVIYAGICWQRNEARFRARIQACLPAPVRELANRR